MDVAFGVGMQMMMPMLRRPPQHAFLGAALSEERQNKLKRPAGRISAMREVPMIPGSNCKEAEPVQCHADENGLPTHARPDGPETGEMDQYERNGRWVNDIVSHAI